MSTEVCIKLFARRRIKRRDRRQSSLSISLSFYQTILGSSPQTRFLFIVRIPKEGHITDYSKVESTVQPAMLCYSGPPQVSLLFTLLHFIMT